MLPRSITACALAILALLLLSGCTSPTDPSAIFTHLSVSRAITSLASHPDEQFSVTQLEALIGKPERILSQGDFYSLIDDIEPGLAHLFREIVKSALPEPDARGKCVIWLYAWTHPMEHHSEIVGFLKHRHVTEHLSWAYVVCGSRVVIDRHIKR